MTIELIRLAAGENSPANPLLVAGAALLGVLLGGFLQLLAAYLNRRHERDLADLAARRESYAKFRSALRSAVVASNRKVTTQAENVVAKC